MNQSTADRFIEVMAIIASIDPDNDEPMRHEMRRCKNAASRALDDAINNAFSIADIARGMQRDAAQAVADVVAATGAPP